MKIKNSTIFGALFIVMAGMGSAHASEKEGVSCPAEYSANYTGSGANRVLKCQKTVYLPSACMPQMDRRFEGDDTCIPPGVGKPTLSGPLLNGAQYPNVPVWERLPNATGPDQFKGVDHKFPGGTLFAGDPKNGVSCGNGYESKTRRSGQEFLCEKIEVTSSKAKCEWGFAYKQDATGNRDTCEGTIPPFQKRATIPEVVMSKEVFAIEDNLGNVNWVLNELNGLDTWTKKVYAYPRVR